MLSVLSFAENLAPLTRRGHVAVSYDKHIIVWGGYFGSSAHIEYSDNELWIFNCVTEKWTIKKSYSLIYPHCRIGAAGVVIRDSMYIFGGYDFQRHNVSSALYQLDLNTFAWREIHAKGIVPPSVMNHVGWVFNGRFYIVGGYGKKGSGKEFSHMNELFEYNIQKNIWAQLKCTGDIPSIRTDHAAATLNGKVYLFGGRQNMHIYSDFYSLDMKTLEWVMIWPDGSENAAFPSFRYSHSLTALPDKFLILYGGSQTRRILGDAWLYDTEGDEWRLLELPTRKARTTHSACCTVFNEVLIYGGHDMPNRRRQQFRNNWLFEAPPPPNRRRMPRPIDTVFIIRLFPKSLFRLCLDKAVKSTWMEQSGTVLPPKLQTIIEERDKNATPLLVDSEYLSRNIYILRSNATLCLFPHFPRMTQATDRGGNLPFHQVHHEEVLVVLRQPNSHCMKYRMLRAGVVFAMGTLIYINPPERKGSSRQKDDLSINQEPLSVGSSTDTAANDRTPDANQDNRPNSPSCKLLLKSDNSGSCSNVEMVGVPVDKVGWSKQLELQAHVPRKRDKYLRNISLIHQRYRYPGSDCAERLSIIRNDAGGFVTLAHGNCQRWVDSAEERRVLDIVKKCSHFPHFMEFVQFVKDFCERREDSGSIPECDGVPMVECNDSEEDSPCRRIHRPQKSPSYLPMSSCKSQECGNVTDDDIRKSPRHKGGNHQKASSNLKPTVGIPDHDSTPLLKHSNIDDRNTEKSPSRKNLRKQRQKFSSSNSKWFDKTAGVSESPNKYPSTSERELHVLCGSSCNIFSGSPDLSLGDDASNGDYFVFDCCEVPDGDDLIVDQQAVSNEPVVELSESGETSACNFVNFSHAGVSSDDLLNSFAMLDRAYERLYRTSIIEISEEEANVTSFNADDKKRPTSSSSGSENKDSSDDVSERPKDTSSVGKTRPS